MCKSGSVSLVGVGVVSHHSSSRFSFTGGASVPVSGLVSGATVYLPAFPCGTYPPSLFLDSLAGAASVCSSIGSYFFRSGSVRTVGAGVVSHHSSEGGFSTSYGSGAPM